MLLFREGRPIRQSRRAFGQDVLERHHVVPAGRSLQRAVSHVLQATKGEASLACAYVQATERLSEPGVVGDVEKRKNVSCGFRGTDAHLIIGRGVVCGGAGLGQVGPPECVAVVPYSSLAGYAVAGFLRNRQ